jgi:hypothetical protein
MADIDIGYTARVGGAGMRSFATWRSEMNKLFSAIAVGMIVATPVLAKTARSYNMAPTARSADQPSTVVIGNGPRHDYVGPQYVGQDPDPAVRSELRRDAGHEAE